ncbi:hypothetical protein V6C53_08865 [Desulfocurvibacter africanus]|uniref:hypothetical protein n=1 Tax=Desulfocurvibacter africanus TaxID=873 RepID=UPI002FD9E542
MNRWILTIAGLLAGVAIGAAALYLTQPVGRYQMAVISATPIHEDRLIILDSATGEGKIFTNKYVKSFTYKQEEFSGLRALKEECRPE